MTEAVIVATARSPIGRAFKGSLKDLRPDDLAATIVQARWTRSRSSTRPTSTTSTSAAACPAASRAQHGQGRRHPARLRPPARRHAHPVLRLVAADHPDGLPRDQGRRGRRLRLRRGRDGVPLRPWQLRTGAAEAQAMRRRRGRTRSPTRRARTKRSRRTRPWTDPRDDGDLPDIYIAMGQTAENLAEIYGVTREDMDEFGVRRRTSPRPPSRTASGTGRSPRSPLPTARS